MPQTRFVLSKALECGLKPIVVINKIDRPDARPHEVLDEAFELLMDLGADDMLDDFPISVASGKDGYATHDPDGPHRLDAPAAGHDRSARSPGRTSNPTRRCRLLVTTLDWSEYVGRIAIGRIQAGTLRKAQNVALMQAGDRRTTAKVASQVFENLGGWKSPRQRPARSWPWSVWKGSRSATRFVIASIPRRCLDWWSTNRRWRWSSRINSSPFRRSRRQVRHDAAVARAAVPKELERNVALRVEPVRRNRCLRRRGRGVMHLSVLIETMRREGFELSVGKPHVILKTMTGRALEPFETLVVEVPQRRWGPSWKWSGNGGASWLK